VILTILYYALPATHGSVAGVVIRLAIGLGLVAVVVAFQTSRILRSELPQLRAAQSLGTVIPLFLVVFATIYLSLSHSSSSEFSQPLDHTRAIYFTVTVFATVGFGDITPKTDTTQIITMVQMILDLVLIGFVVRLLLNAVTSAVRDEGGREGHAD